MSSLERLANFPPANYLKPGTEAERTHRHARDINASPEARALKLLADAIYAQAEIASDFYHCNIVRELLASFVELLSLERGGWDGGTCSSWAYSVGEYIGLPLD